MITLILDGFIVKENGDDGKMFYYSDIPDCCRDSEGTAEFTCRKAGDLCFDIDVPIRGFVDVNEPVKCKITIELDK